MTEVIVGLVLAIAVGMFATMVGLDRDRAFYPAVTLVVAHYYILFAVMGGSARALQLESLVATGFLALAVIGFRTSLWIAAVALAGHGLFDLTHDRLIANAGVPSWWPAFCCAYDVVAAAYLAVLLSRGRIRATA